MSSYDDLIIQGWFDEDLIKAAGTSGNYVITAQFGSYALTGQTATVQRSKLLNASAGSYALSGQTAILVKGRVLTASNGIYALTGQTATLVRGRVLAASAGSYAVTGQSAVITYTPIATGYTLTALAGSYSITGQTAALSRSKLLTASAGSYASTGQQAVISKGRNLSLQSGSYAVSGQPATISYATAGGYTLIALSGSYQVSGQAASIETSAKRATGGFSTGQLRDFARKTLTKRQIEDQRRQLGIIASYPQQAAAAVVKGLIDPDISSDDLEAMQGTISAQAERLSRLFGLVIEWRQIQDALALQIRIRRDEEHAVIAVIAAYYAAA